jgi:hypothetical protein
MTDDELDRIADQNDCHANVGMRSRRHGLKRGVIAPHGYHGPCSIKSRQSSALVQRKHKPVTLPTIRAMREPPP